MTPSADAAERARLTFQFDRVKGACHGILETGWSTFALLVAVRVFEASPTAKASLAAGTQLGYLLAPLSLFLVARSGFSPSSALSRLFGLAGLMILLSLVSRSAVPFVVTLMMGAALAAQHSPLMLQVYAQNYAPDRRGRLLSQSLVVSVLAAMLFSLIGGRLLDQDLGYYRHLFLFMAAAAFVGAWALSRMRSEPLPRNAGNNPLRCLAYAWTDRVFGFMLVVWMIMGLGNLIMVPLRVEYMANARFGINATNTEIALVTLVIPSAVRVFFTHLWGNLFDRYDFFLIRGLLNGCFLAAILLFFNSHTLFWLGVSGAIIGMALAGSNIAWSLWVTKFAPPERVSDYMSVHTFLTGLRGIVAPFIGFYLLSVTTPATVSWLAAGMIGLSMLLLDPVRRKAAGAAAAG